MRNLSIKNVTFPSLMLCLAILSFTCSCSSSDDKDAPIVFTSINANKTDVFTEEAIVLNLEGSEFRDVNVTSSNSSVIIKKISSTVYEVASTVAGSVNVFVELSNDSDKKHKSVTLNFCAHGIKDFNTVEGIKPNIDKASKVLSLLGEPFQKTTSTSGTIEFWNYPSKGLSIAITKSSTVVNSINILSSNYYIPLVNGTNTYYTNYPYDLGNGWKINNVNTTIDMVITKFGAASEKINSPDPSSPLRTYGFAYQNMYVSFYGASIDDYIGKTIKSILVY